MIKDRQKFLNKLHVVLDAVMVFLAYAAAYLVRFVWQKAETYQWANDPLNTQALLYYGKALLGIIPGYLMLYAFFGMYSSKRILGRRRELSGILASNIVGVLVLTFVLYLIKRQYFFSGYMIFYFAMSNVCFAVTERSVVRIILFGMRRKGYNQKHVILAGYSNAAEKLIDRINSNPQWGFNVQGILDDNKPIGEGYQGVNVIGKLSDLGSILEANQLDEIMITLGLAEYTKLTKVVATIEKSGVHTRFIPDYGNVIPTSPYTEDLLGLPMINIRHVPLMEGTNAFIKRVMDVLVSLFCIILFSPVMLICVIAVKLTSPGPIIFCQERVGLHNRPFKMYKFRSMVQQTEEDEKKGWTTKNDPRVTRFGALMRKTSMDELPQFFNVLKGDMSVVGPRPERPQYVEQFRETIPRYMIKHQVKPGITGWAQVKGYRGDSSIEKRIECDLYYIENWTIGLDLKILLMTPFTGLVNKNAY
ncbi:MAG: undecaprenyl-phosphate glucose phosphotransferase [Lachnospiraceae bacterium]|nr:undecaprenyl-phosphate glucose phosphotransferase [Lachnospiraceae bacterium]